MQSIDSTKTYAREMSEDIIHVKENIERYNIIQRCLTLTMSQKKDIKTYNPNQPEIPDHPYRILIIGGLESAKVNVLLHLRNHEHDTDKYYLYPKDPYGAIYQLLINKREITGLNTQIIGRILK